MRAWMTCAASVAFLLTLSIAPPLRGQAPVTTTAIPGVVAAGTPVTLIKGGWDHTEGTIAAPDGTAYFTVPGENKIFRGAADDTMTVLFDAMKRDDPKDPSGDRWRTTALAVDRQGRIFATRRAGKQVGIAIVYPPAAARFVADAYQGRPFTAANDLTMAQSGDIYFTEAGMPRGVYHIRPSGEVVLATAEVGRPNGILLSRDDKTLYVSDSQSEYLLVFDVMADGTVGNRRNFAHLAGVKKTDKGIDPGIDGMALDSSGRVYAISHAGIEVFTPAGKALGIIPLPAKAQNLAFAGKDLKTLYVVASGGLYRIRMLAQGFAGRAK